DAARELDHALERFAVETRQEEILTCEEVTRAEARLLVIVTRFLSEILRGRPVLVQAGGREQDWLHEIDFRLRTLWSGVRGALRRAAVDPGRVDGWAGGVALFAAGLECNRQPDGTRLAAQIREALDAAARLAAEARETTAAVLQ